MLQVTLLARDKVYISKPLGPLRESIQLRSFQWDVGGSDPFSHCLVAQSCPTLRNDMDWSPPSSSVHEISQARILEWIAISFSKGSS